MGQRRALGDTGLEVSPLCLGGNVFGWTADADASFAVLDSYIAQGGNFIDTANIYSAWAPGNVGGESETIIGRWLVDRGGRDDLVIATKVGMAGGLPTRKGLTRDKIRRGIEGSLRRLQVDSIDVFYAHEDDEGPRWLRRWPRSTSWCAKASCELSEPRTAPPSGWVGRL